MWMVLSVNAGTSANSAYQARAKPLASASTQWVGGIIASGMAGRSIGRVSRTRRSLSPASSIRLGVGIFTAGSEAGRVGEEGGRTATTQGGMLHYKKQTNAH